MSRSRRVRVGRSLIQGRGVFAAQRFRPGAPIGTFEGRPTRTDGTYVLWLVDDDGSQTGIRGSNELRFLNHSSNPNAEFEGLELVALRNIQPGCEITLDYGEAWRDVD
jgi:SET domain-containing protein